MQFAQFNHCQKLTGVELSAHTGRRHAIINGGNFQTAGVTGRITSVGCGEKGRFPAEALHPTEE